MRESTTDYRVLRNYGNKKKRYRNHFKSEIIHNEITIYCQPMIPTFVLFNTFSR